MVIRGATDDSVGAQDTASARTSQNYAECSEYLDAFDDTEDSSDSTEHPKPFHESTYGPDGAAGMSNLHRASSGRSMYTRMSESDMPSLSLTPSRHIDKRIVDAEEKEKEEVILGSVLHWLWNFVKPDFIVNHLDLVSIRPVIRTWAAWWTMAILMLISKTDKYAGRSPYLLLVGGIIEHSGGVSVAAGFLTSLLDLTFVLIAFAHMIISHAICWKIRGRPTESDVLQQLIKENLCPAGPDGVNCMLDLMYHGHFLTTKTTVVNVLAMIFCLAIIGYPPIKRRIFILPWMFGALTTIVSGSYLNLTPWFGPWTTGKSLIVPLGLSFSARLFFCCAILPTTSNCKFFTGLIRAHNEVIGIFSKYVHDQVKLRPSMDEYDKPVPGYGEKAIQSLDGFRLLELDGLVTRYEVAYARLDAGNLGEFRSHVRLIAIALSGFQFFHEGIAEKRNAIRETNVDEEDSQSRNGDRSQEYEPQGQHISPYISQSSHPKIRSSRRRADTFSGLNDARQRGVREGGVLSMNWLNRKLQKNYKSSGQFEMHRQDYVACYNWDGTVDVDMTIEELDALYASIIEHYRPLNDATAATLDLTKAWMIEANKYRFFTLFFPSYLRKRQKLQRERAKEIADAYKKLIDEIEKTKKVDDWLQTSFHDENSTLTRLHYTYSLSQDALYGYVSRQCAVRAKRLAKYCIVLDEHQSTAKFIWPFTKSRSRQPRYEAEYVSSESLDMNAAGDQGFAAFAPLEGVQKRDPDSSPPRTPFHLFGRLIMRWFRAITAPKVVFCLKRAVISTMANSLYFTKTTADFAYRYRLIWVGIMTAFTLSHHAVDGSYGFIAKLVYTFLGCLTGMVAWYISAGSGNGNAIGLGAVLAVVFLFLSFHRHYNKHRIPAATTILTVTVALVTGISWMNKASPTPGTDLGQGFRVAWMRFTEVTVGLVIAFMFTLLPHPYTAKKAIRVTLGQCLERIGDLQSTISNFSLQRYEDANVRIALRSDLIIKKKMAVFSMLASASAMRKSLDFEPPLGGVWPKHKYGLLIKLELETTQLYGHLHYLIDDIQDTKLIPGFLTRIGWSSAELTSGVYSVYYMASRALQSGTALPSITPAHLSEQYTETLRAMLATEERNVFEKLIEEHYTDHDGRLLLSAIMMVSYIYEHIDGMMILIKGLVGELFDTQVNLCDHDIEALPLMHLFDSDSDSKSPKSPKLPTSPKSEAKLGAKLEPALGSELEPELEPKKQSGSQ